MQAKPRLRTPCHFSSFVRGARLSRDLLSMRLVRACRLTPRRQQPRSSPGNRRARSQPAPLTELSHELGPSSFTQWRSW
jgi:hypothetical protein